MSKRKEGRAAPQYPVSEVSHIPMRTLRELQIHHTRREKHAECHLQPLPLPEILGRPSCREVLSRDPW
jgi:hypothetical protein